MYTALFYRSLQQLLDYKDGSVEDVFGLTFSINTEVFGELHILDLIPNGRNINVTDDNR